MDKYVSYRRFGTLHYVEQISDIYLTNYMERDLLVKAIVA